MPQRDEWLRAEDVAEILNIGMNQTYSLLKDGEIIGIQIGRKRAWRVQRSELDAFIARELDKARRRAETRAADSDAHATRDD